MMGDAPETVFLIAEFANSTAIAKTRSRYMHSDAEYRLASLPATNSQALANPRVQALKRNLEMARLWLAVDGRFDLQGIDAALAALDTEETPDG